MYSEGFLASFNFYRCWTVARLSGNAPDGIGAMPAFSISSERQFSWRIERWYYLMQRTLIWTLPTLHPGYQTKLRCRHYQYFASGALHWGYHYCFQILAISDQIWTLDVTITQHLDFGMCTSRRGYRAAGSTQSEHDVGQWNQGYIERWCYLIVVTRNETILAFLMQDSGGSVLQNRPTKRGSCMAYLSLRRLCLLSKAWTMGEVRVLPCNGEHWGEQA